MPQPGQCVARRSSHAAHSCQSASIAARQRAHSALSSSRRMASICSLERSICASDTVLSAWTPAEGVGPSALLLPPGATAAAWRITRFTIRPGYTVPGAGSNQLSTLRTVPSGLLHQSFAAVNDVDTCRSARSDEAYGTLRARASCTMQVMHGSEA